MLPVNKETAMMLKDLDIKALEEECQELKTRLGAIKEGMEDQRSGDVEELLRQSQKELLWLQRQLSFISERSSLYMFSQDKQLRNEPLSPDLPAVTTRNLEQIQLLEDKNSAFRVEVATLKQDKQHCRLLEKEVNRKRKECENLKEEVKKRQRTCQTLENELKDVLQEKNCLNLELVSLTQKTLQYDQVKLEYDQLRETLNIVTQKRDLAVKEKIHLQAKLENLEQVLTHMREAAERRQQLELEHEQAFAVLNAKQQEINLLQKAQVEAKKEHEGAVQLLENTLDSMQAKVRELEQKCRTQSEQFNLLSKELEKFRLQAGHFDLLSANSLAVCDTPGSPSKSLSQLLHALAIPIGKGSESPSANRSLISEFIRPIQISGDKPELLSVKPTFLTRSHPSSPRRGFLAEMDNEPGSTSSKVRYTGKVRLCIARYSYNPYDGPNENPEAELPLIAGKYIYVYGNMDEDGFYEGELLDGQRGLVPSNFVDFIQDEEVPSVQTADNGKDQAYLNHTGLGHERGSGILTDSKFDGSMSGEAPATTTTTTTTTTCNNGAGTLDVSIDEIGEDIVPYPRKINLIKQLAKSVIVGWEPPVVPPAWGIISGYNVLVDKEVRMSIPFGGRTKFLIEKLNLSACTYRISIQSITGRGISEELRCTMLVGKDVVVAPYQLRVDNITQVSAELSWWPSNSNYSHTIFLNDVEYDMVKAASYRYQFFNLKPNMAYKVKVVAQPHQMPWQLPLEQREKREITVEFCTQPAGPPAPPLDVMVQSGPAPGLIQVSWKPPPLTQMGMSNGANVIGYAVCTRGQKVAEVMFPTADSVMVELMRLQCLGANEVIVRTISAQGESQDSPLAVIPHSLLLPPVPHPRSAPNPKPLASAREPETKEEPGTVHSARLTEPWEPARSPSPIHPGHSLEPPHFHSPSQGRRSPSPQRILPQPQGAPIPNTVAKAIAREAAQRVAESNRMEKRNIFSERSTAIHPLNSDEEEDGYESPHRKRQGASVDEFLRGSELGRQPLQYSHSEDYQTESSRGSDLSDIMEEDEEELYSEMQLEEGGRRRSITSHSALKILGDPSSTGRADRMDHSGRRLSHGSAVQQRPRPMMVPSIEITMDSNSEAGRSRPGGQRNVSPVKEDVYYRTVPGHRKWPLQRGMASEHRYDGYGGREQHSPEFYEESEPEDMSRIFVALFDYDPLSMSPNPDAADEELAFKEGQIMKVYGDKDTDGFYRGEICGRDGLIPCNMVSEIQTDDDEMMEKLIKQGFLPLNTPVEKIVNCDRFKDSARSVNRRSRKSKRERNRRSGRQHSVSTTRMVALYDYDPRESSPNVDVEREREREFGRERLKLEAELTFCAGDIITVFGEIDEDGFYYGEINGQKGLVPSNFLEEVPDDVEVYLSETPSRHAHDTPVRTKTKRVPSENAGPSRRAPSPTVHPGSGPGTMGMGSPIRGREFSSKKKKGLLSKGKKLLKKLGAVK
ncbi:RIMS-binding protein 2-like isoform X2 [Acipenser ruthenus]|nr:RIMS-binding protein 2-like isoform X2 [Acipenser ruthenus]